MKNDDPAKVSFGKNNKFKKSNIATDNTVSGDLVQTITNYIIHVPHKIIFLLILILTAIATLGTMLIHSLQNPQRQPQQSLASKIGQVIDNPFEFPPARIDETLIIIAGFPRAGETSDQEIPSEIQIMINHTAEEVGLKGKIRPEISRLILDENDTEGALKLGQQYGASVVIWGLRNDSHVRIRVLDLINPAQLGEVMIDEKHRVPARSELYIEFVNTDLPNYVSFLVHFSRAISLYKAGESHQANILMDQVIVDTAILSSSLEANFNRAKIYVWKGWLEYASSSGISKSLEWYDKAIELFPEYLAAYYTRAYLYKENGEKKKAIADLQTIIMKSTAINPDHLLLVRTYNQLGYIYNQLGHWTDAHTALTSGLAITTTLGELHKNLAITLLKGGEESDPTIWMQAKKSFGTAFQSGLSTPIAEKEAHFWLGWIAIKTGNDEEACKEWTALQTIGQRPNLGSPANTKAVQTAVADAVSAFEIDFWPKQCR